LDKITSIGDRLKYLRESANLSQNEVAKLCFIARSTYAQYETDVSYPPQEIQITLSKFYNVSLDYLNGLTDYSTSVLTDSKSEDLYKSIPLLSLPDLKALRKIKTPYEKVQRGPFCYILSPCNFNEYRITKNDLLLVKRSSKVKPGDLLLVQTESEHYIGRCFITDNFLILYSSNFTTGFMSFDKDTYSVIGKITEVTISI